MHTLSVELRIENLITKTGRNLANLLLSFSTNNTFMLLIEF